MNKQEFIEQLEDLLEMKRGSLAEDEMLFNLEGWDSLSVMSFIAMVDEELEETLKATQIAEAKSVQDLIALVSHKLEG